ncbi:MAG: MFS transporter [Candidatus Lokiarchaeota archaeon]|nr:MFS transporter [Candidatus Lokiarchaeota archaeon]
MNRDNYLIMVSTFCHGIGLGLQIYFAIIRAGILINPILSALMMGVYFATASIASMIFGKLSDHVKKRKIFGILGNILCGVVYIQYFFITDMIFFLLFSFFAGITTSLVSATIPALYSELDPHTEKGMLMSWYNISNSAGWAVSVFLGEIFFIFMQNFIYFLFGFVTISAALFLIPIREKHLEKNRNESEIKTNNSHFDKIKPFLIFIAIIVAFRHCTSQGTISSLLPNFLVLELQASEFVRGFIYSFNTFLQVGLMIPIGRLVDKHGRRNVLILGVSFSMIAAFGYSLCITPWQVLPFQICVAIGWTCLINSASAYIIDITTENDRAKGVGLLNAGLFIGGSAGPFLASLSLTIFYGSFQLSFIFLSLFAIPGIILCLLLKEDKENHVYQIFSKKSKIIESEIEQ